MNKPRKKMAQGLLIPGMGRVSHKEMIQATREGGWIDSRRGGRIDGAYQRLAGDLNLDDCPDDYTTLRDQARVASGLANYFLVVMGQRLCRIRDGKLYEGDYGSFKEFVASELQIGRSTAYDYMAIYEHFGALMACKKAENVDYSKLLPVIPLLNAKNEQIPREAIKRDFLARVHSGSYNDFCEQASQLKADYGLSKHAGATTDPLAQAIEKLVSRLPRKPTVRQRKQLAGLINRLQRVIDPS